MVPGASFTEDLGADSLDAVELIMAIEEAYERNCKAKSSSLVQNENKLAKNAERFS